MAKSIDSISKLFHRRSKSQGGEAESDSLDFLTKSLKGSAQTDMPDLDFKPIDPISSPPSNVTKFFEDSSDTDSEVVGGAKKKKRKKSIEKVVRTILTKSIEPLQTELEKAQKKLAHLNSVSGSFHYDANRDRLIHPPETIKSVDAVRSVDRNAKVKHLFSHIPPFDPHDSSIRDWLLNVNAAVNNADYKLTDGELKSVIITRLNDKTRAMLSPWEKSKKEIYDDLVSHFDKSETMEQAQTKLCTMRPDKRIHNLFEFLCEAKRLLRLCPTEDPRMFTMALCNFVPKEVENQIKEKILRYKAHEGEKSYPDVNEIIKFAVINRDKIDDYIEEQVKINKKVRTVQVESQAPPPAQQTPPPKPKYSCSHCNRKGHNSEDCFNLAICTLCGRKGHNDKVCRNKGCLKCGKLNHTYAECFTYPKTESGLSTRPCRHCVKLHGMKLYHFEDKCLIRSVMDTKKKN